MLLVTLLRRALTGLWYLAIVGLLGLAAFSHLAEPIVIRGGSMEPAIPIGSLITLRSVASDAPARGDIVTVRAANGVLITHRVVRSVDLDGEQHLELKGDANGAPDPVLVSAATVVGGLDLQAPTLGYLVTMLSTLSGMFSLLSMLGAVLLAIWLLEDVEEAGRTGRALAGVPRAASV